MNKWYLIGTKFSPSWSHHYWEDSVKKHKKYTLYGCNLFSIISKNSSVSHIISFVKNLRSVIWEPTTRSYKLALQYAECFLMTFPTLYFVPHENWRVKVNIEQKVAKQIHVWSAIQVARVRIPPGTEKPQNRCAGLKGLISPIQEVLILLIK